MVEPKAIKNRPAKSLAATEDVNSAGGLRPSGRGRFARVTLSISREEEIKILRRIVDITCSDLDLAGILDEVVGIVNEMTKADSIFVYLFDHGKKKFGFKSFQNPPQKSPRQDQFARRGRDHGLGRRAQ